MTGQMIKLGLFVMFSLTACLAGGGSAERPDKPGGAVPSAQDKEMSRLEKNRTKWKENRPQSYEFVLEHSQWGNLPEFRKVLITVEGNKVIDDEDLEKERALRTPRKDVLLTIDEVFGLIERKLKNKPDKVEIVYDESLGYPRSVKIDPVKEMYDEEYAFTIELVTD